MDLSLDIETFSALPLKKCGAHRYAEEAEVMLVAWAIDDGDVTVWDMTAGDATLGDVQKLIDGAETIVAHNSAFERTIFRHQGIDLPAGKIEDTMVRALRHGLLGDLGKLCEVLGVPFDKAKDKDGKKLINLFCSPCPKNWNLRRATRETHPDEWTRFIEYSRLDVVSMRDVRGRLPHWCDTPTERDYWLLDQQVNDRGFAVDVQLAVAAVRAFRGVQRSLSADIARLTDGAVASATERDKFLAFMRDECHLDMPDITEATVGLLLRGDLEPLAKELLEIRQQASRTTPAKYDALVAAVGRDSRLRGTLQYCGAARTGRDAGRIFQPQNLVRTPDWFDACVQAATVRAFKAEAEDVLYSDVADRCAFAVRGCLVAEPGNKLVIADLSNIEGRVLAWLAGEEWKLDAFKAYDRGEGEDLYKVGAGRILGKPASDVTKDERQKIGKVSELACGYGGAVGAFRTMGGRAVEALSDDEIVAIVRGWRSAHLVTKRFWYAVEAAARSALRHEGDEYRAGLLHLDAVTDVNKLRWLRIRLPSGRYLCYLNPDPGTYACPVCGGSGVAQEAGGHLGTCNTCAGTGTAGSGEMTFEGVDQYTKQWGIVRTYGPKLVENATQAVARDILFHGFKAAEAAGYKTVLRVHDELVCEVPDSPEFNAEHLSQLMSQLPRWALGLPLAAAGFECLRYRKG